MTRRPPSGSRGSSWKRRRASDGEAPIGRSRSGQESERTGTGERDGGQPSSSVARSFFRIVKTDPPTLRDFLSDRERGRPQPRDSELRRLHDGLSVYATLAQARRKARAFPVLGRHVAELRIPPDAPIRYERTLLGSAGHHTIWGEPDELRRCVVSVDPV